MKLSVLPLSISPFTSEPSIISLEIAFDNPTGTSSDDANIVLDECIVLMIDCIDILVQCVTYAFNPKATTIGVVKLLASPHLGCDAQPVKRLLSVNITQKLCFPS